MSENSEKATRATLVLEVAKTVFERPSDLILGFARILAAVLCTHCADPKPETIRACTQEVCKMITELVDRGIALKESYNRAEKAEEN